MASTAPLTAAQQVMTSNYLVHQILLRHDELTFGGSGTSNPQPRQGNEPSRSQMLRNYSTINTVWFYESMSRLWAHGTAKKSVDLKRALKKITPARRQFYADLIQSACLYNPVRGNHAEYNRFFRRMHFPKLRHMVILIKKELRHGFQMPLITAQNLEAFYIRLGVMTQSRRAVTFRPVRRAGNLQSRVAILLAAHIERVQQSCRLVVVGDELLVKPSVRLRWEATLPGTRLMRGPLYTDEEGELLKDWINRLVSAPR
ncbi:hypothetical protein N7454_010386 [Penicillium verhagenii]|nr:hypothetical protein N7454_010386 [Penicillium verhagenii]